MGAVIAGEVVTGAFTLGAGVLGWALNAWQAWRNRRRDKRERWDTDIRLICARFLRAVDVFFKVSTVDVAGHAQAITELSLTFDELQLAAPVDVVAAAGKLFTQVAAVKSVAAAGRAAAETEYYSRMHDFRSATRKAFELKTYDASIFNP